MKIAKKPNFQMDPEDYDSYSERAIEEASLDIYLNRHRICKEFSWIEKEIYQKCHALKYRILSMNRRQLMQAELDQFAKFDHGFERNSFLSEKNYVIFVYLKQCERFQMDLDRYSLNINHLETNDDTKKLVELFIKNYKLLELIPPSNSLYGSYDEDRAHRWNLF